METTITALQEVKRIALVAHDNMKPQLLKWARDNKHILARHKLCGTGTTGYIIEAEIGLDVEEFMSGPLGGDQQLGAKIAEGYIDLLIFFWDPLQQLPHDPDVKALLRLAALWNIPVACNAASADYLITSPLVNVAYERETPDYKAYIKNRTKGIRKNQTSD